LVSGDILIRIIWQVFLYKLLAIISVKAKNKQHINVREKYFRLDTPWFNSPKKTAKTHEIQVTLKIRVWVYPCLVV
jgi:hypothetical protein